MQKLLVALVLRSSYVYIRVQLSLVVWILNSELVCIGMQILLVWEVSCVYWVQISLGDLCSLAYQYHPWPGFWRVISLY